MRRLCIDFDNEEKAKALYTQLLADESRHVDLIEWHIGTLTFFTVGYFTKGSRLYEHGNK